MTEIEIVGWAILQALHEGVDDAPQSWSDLAEDQERRIKKAAIAAIEAVADLSQYTAQGFSRATPSPIGGDEIKSSASIVSIKSMRLSSGETDYFVAIRVEDREVTPHVFREEYKAAYHVALYKWLLNGTDKPDLVTFSSNDWPARVVKPGPSGAIGARTREEAQAAVNRLRAYAGIVDSDAYADEAEPNFVEDVELICAILSLSGPSREETIEECARIVEEIPSSASLYENGRIAAAVTGFKGHAAGEIRLLASVSRPDRGGDQS